MQVGIELAANPASAACFAARQCAQAAEAVGYDAVWVVLRSLVPPSGPVALLADAAAATARVRLGISADRLPWASIPPLDGLPAERLSVGLTVDGPLISRRERGWRPPWRLLLSAGDDAGLDAVVRHGDGWHAVGLSIPDLASGTARLRRLAAGHGRDPAELAVVARADITVTTCPVGAGRGPFMGSVDQVAADLLAAQEAGVDEVLLSVGGEGPLDLLLETYAELVERLQLNESA